MADHGNRYRKGCRCDDCREAHTAKCREYRDAMIVKHGRIPSQVNRNRIVDGRTCELCTEAFTAQSGSPTRFCSLTCASRATGEATGQAIAARARLKRRHRSQVVPYAGPPHRRTPKPRRNPIAVSKRCFKSAQCRICDAWFVTLNTDVTCSPDCQSELQHIQRQVGRDRRRARQRNAYVADVYRKRVFERDGYRCHLCRKKTRPDKLAPHPRSPTIDHVIPLAVGGTHEPLNCRTACYLCNSRKSHGGGGEQMLLIA